LLGEARELEVRLLTDDFQRFFGEYCAVEKELQDSENQETVCVAEEVRLVVEQQQAQLELGAFAPHRGCALREAPSNKLACRGETRQHRTAL